MYDLIDWSQDHYGIVSKLIFNQSIVANTEGILRGLGMVHLYSASGIHIYALMDAIGRLTLFLNRILKTRWFWLQTFGLFAGLILIGFAWHLQDYRLGFTRPIFIFLIRLWARRRGVRWRLLYPLTIMLVLDFLFQIESGRLHYYLAVGGGLLGLEVSRLRSRGLFAEHVAMSVGSWLLTAMVDLIDFHQVIWMTPIWSLVTLPLISLILYPITLISVLLFRSIPDTIFLAWNELIDFCVSIMDLGFTFSIVTREAFVISAFFAFISFVMIYWIRLPKIKVLAGVCLIVGACVFRVWNPRFQEVFVVQFDVKQGDALLVQKENRTEMVDVGSRKALKPHQWLQKFSHAGITQVNTVLLSHLDEDHSGGLLNLVAFVSIDEIQVHQKCIESEKGKRLIVRVNERATVRFTQTMALRLMKVAYFESELKINDGNSFMAGVVVPIDANRAYFGLGDGDITQESKYIRYFKNDIEKYPYKIWKAGHHGSKYSSGGDQLALIHPNEIWVSVGKKNQYHHPSIEAMTRISRSHAQVYRTDQVGDLYTSFRTSWFW